MSLLVLLGLLCAATVSVAQQSPPPLKFANNFFVTGDYVVAGAYNMTKSFTTINGISYAVGTINVPDTNPGIQGATSVPNGAQVVAALLYWQTVEKQGITAGGPGTGANGYFRPLLYAGKGGPAAPGYSLQGTSLDNEVTNPVFTGCSGTSSGKVVQTYRADVTGGLPADSNGNPVVNGSFEVRLPSTNNSQPFTLGATLVVIYRIPGVLNGRNIPLNSIVIYDGAYGQSKSGLTMSQPLKGFYDADNRTISRLTHIAATGQSNKTETVSLAGANLSSPYGSKLPSFPGWYGNWDNPTWTFPSGSSPLAEDSSNATTNVVPGVMNPACLSWGAVIMSTTVKDTDKDGLLDSWESAKGYCDYSTNASCSGSQDAGWVDLPGADPNAKDVYLQYDYMCSSVSGGSCAGASYSFDPRLAVDNEDTAHANAIDKVVAAYANHQISLHVSRGHAILEDSISCLDSDPTCTFPNEPGTVGFSAGLEYIKNQTIDSQTGKIGCDPSSDGNCGPVFQHGKKDSYHYALFSHGVGVPNWFLSDGSLTSVSQSGSTVTFTTSSSHGISPIPGDNLCSAANGYIGRITVVSAISNPNLNGTFCAKAVGSPALPNKFFITLPTSSSSLPSYTKFTDPNLGVANGKVTSISGFSDVGGQNSIISLGVGGWGPPEIPSSDGKKWQNVAGTLMHELGHTMALTHGGTFYNNLANNDYTPTFEVNCKPNVQSSMSYLFQFDLLEKPNTFNAAHNPEMVVDYSEEALPTLTESSPGTGLSGAAYAKTAWFQLTSFAVGPPLTLASAANASGGSTIYTGTIIGGDNNAFAGKTFTVTGFTNAANNGTFVATASSAATLTLSNASGVSEAHAAIASHTGASPHCDGTPLLANEPSKTYVSDSVGNFFWSNTTGLDVNFNGSSSDIMQGHDEWDGTPAQNAPGLDLRQVSAFGTISAVGPGGDEGGLHSGGGGLHSGGGGLHTGGGGLHSGGGGLHSGGGGLHTGGGAPAEFTHDSANSYARPPRGLSITEEKASPRNIVLNWFIPTFGTVVNYNVYRSDAGAAFKLVGTPSQTTFTDTVMCNPNGYSYRLTAVTINDAGQPQESVPSNTVPATGEPLLTGCYLVNPFTVPANATHGTDISISWALLDDFFITLGDAWAHAAQSGVSAVSSAQLFVNGPAATGHSCAITPQNSQTQLATITNGVIAVQETGDVLTTSGGGAYSFTWNNANTDQRCSGSYTFELDLDSGQKIISSPLLLGLDINNQDNIRINPFALADATADVSYTNTLSQEGGVGTVSWSISAGSLPAGIQLTNGANNTGVISGFTTTPGTYHFTVKATDQNGNIGTQAFTLVVHIFVSGTAPGGAPPFTANPALPAMTVGNSSPDTVFQAGAVGNTNWSITGSFPAGISQQGSTAVISGTTCVAGSYALNAAVTDSATPTNTGSLALTLPVNQANTTTSVGSNVPTSVFQQPVTFTVTVTPQGSCGPATGTVTVLDGGIPIASSLPLSGGKATFMTSALSVAVHSITATYTGDANFNASNSNATPFSQTVNKASTSMSFSSVLPSTIFVGQPITVSFTFGVVSPGLGSPVAPTGNIMVAASDGSSCVANPTLGGGSCQLSPAPTAAGHVTFTITYPGDGNFVTSGDNGSYDVYKLVFTTQPSTTGVGLTMPAVVVTAEDSGGGTLGTFTGGITVAIGSGSGTLSGTTTQNAVAGVATFSDLSINKIATGDTLKASPGGVVFDATSTAFNIDSFYVDNQGNFGTLDLPTGTATQIGSGATVPNSTGLDLTPSLAVYTYNASNQLMQITPSTGAATAVGSPGSVTFAATGALAGGTYYGIDATTGTLYSIDTETGATGSGIHTGVAVLPAGCNLEASLTGSASVLYYTVGYSGGSCSSPMPDTLYQINPSDGTTTAGVQLTINSSGVNTFIGSTFVAGTLYGFTSDGNEYTIDNTSGNTAGAATFVANTTVSGTNNTVAIIGAGSQ